jgi:hypothetical protein
MLDREVLAQAMGMDADAIFERKVGRNFPLFKDCKQQDI